MEYQFHLEALQLHTSGHLALMLPSLLIRVSSEKPK